MDKEIRGLRWLFFGLAGILLLFANRDRLMEFVPELPNAGDFKKEVLDSERPVLVKLGADWCGPCRKMEESLDEFEVISQGKVKVLRVNVDYQRDWARQLNVSSIPHTFLYANGQLVSQKVGYMDGMQLSTWVANGLGINTHPMREIPVSTHQ